MLVQAKLLDDRDQEYSHIDRFIGKTGIRQIDQLISTSTRRKIPAIYVFYNHLKERGRIPLHVCGSFDCAECWGCSVALAGAVKVASAKDFDTLKVHSKPWVCLLCQGMASSDAAPARVLYTLRDLYDRSRRIFHEQDISFENVAPLPEHPSSQHPSYFERLIRIDSATDSIDGEEILARVAEENPDIDGIVLATDVVAHDRDRR
jgi:hypothetical protein